MKFTLTSITGIALSTNALESLTIPTLDGVITVLPGHMALMTAIKPGVLSVSYEKMHKNFAIGGGVLETDGNEVRIVADMIEDGGHDLEAITARKLEAEKLMAEYREKGDPISMEALLDLEQQYLKESAREQLASSQHA